MSDNLIDDSSSEEIHLEVSQSDREEFKRLDQFLAARISHLSRTFLKRLFEAQQIELENDDGSRKLELKKMPPVGSKLVINVPPPVPSEATPENIPLEILYQDDDLIIINKAPGMVVHPAPGNENGTLVNAILYHCPTIQGVGGVKRPGIVHRLDKGTSGVMVVAKNQQAHEAMVIKFAKHDLEREYQAICLNNHLPNKQIIESLIARSQQNRLKMTSKTKNGKRALTHFTCLEQLGPLAHVQCRLETGRTHQIRVHLSEVLNAPIFGDTTYGFPVSSANERSDRFKHFPKEFFSLIRDYPYPFLHAKLLAFTHPMTGAPLRFEVPPPSLFQSLLSLLAEFKVAQHD